MPVFPLPRVVFFPRTILPLHVFEPRYRAMVREASQSEGLIAVSLLEPGWESDYEGNPPFHKVGTVGRIEDLEALPRGLFNLRLVGLQRVRFGDEVRARPFRVRRVEPLPEIEIDESEPSILTAKLELLASHGCLVRELADDGKPGFVLDDRTSFEAAVNGACANLPVDPARRQRLLEEDDLLRRQRRASALLDEVLERVLRLKALRSGRDGTGGLN